MKWLLPASEQCAAQCLPPLSNDRKKAFSYDAQELRQHGTFTGPQVSCIVVYLNSIQIRALIVLSKDVQR